MAAFNFDVLNTTGCAWDEEPVECSSRDAIERHARDLLARAQSHHDGGMYPVSITVFSASLALVLTLIGRPEGAVLHWNWT